MSELYDALRSAGCALDHHESDLYVRDTPIARRILAKYPRLAAQAELFQTTGGERWIDVPFQWAPFWRKEV